MQRPRRAGRPPGWGEGCHPAGLHEGYRAAPQGQAWHRQWRYRGRLPPRRSPVGQGQADGMAPGSLVVGEGSRPPFVSGSSGPPRTPVDAHHLRTTSTQLRPCAAENAVGRLDPQIRSGSTSEARRGTRSSARAAPCTSHKSAVKSPGGVDEGTFPGVGRSSYAVHAVSRTNLCGDPEPHTEPSLRERLRRPWTPPAPRPSRPLPRKGPRWSVPELIRSTPASSAHLTPTRTSMNAQVTYHRTGGQGRGRTADLRFSGGGPRCVDCQPARPAAPCAG